MRRAASHREELGLGDDEVTIYDVLWTNDSTVAVLGDETMRTLARDLAEALPGALQTKSVRQWSSTLGPLSRCPTYPRPVKLRHLRVERFRGIAHLDWVPSKYPGGASGVR